MFIHRGIFEKTVSAVPLGTLHFLAELKVFICMKYDHRRYCKRSFSVFSILPFQVSSELDGVILAGLVDDAALASVTKKNKNRINNFKNLHKVLLILVILMVIHSKKR